MAQSASDTKPEIPRIGVDEAWADAAIASVAVNERQLCFAHLPCLLHEPMKPSASDDLGGMKSVKVYFNSILQAFCSPSIAPGHRDEQYRNPACRPSAATTLSNGFQTNLVVDCFS